MKNLAKTFVVVLALSAAMFITTEVEAQSCNFDPNVCFFHGRIQNGSNFNVSGMPVVLFEFELLSDVWAPSCRADCDVLHTYRITAVRTAGSGQVSGEGYSWNSASTVNITVSQTGCLTVTERSLNFKNTDIFNTTASWTVSLTAVDNGTGQVCSSSTYTVTLNP